MKKREVPLLEQELRFGWSQELLREVVSSLDEQVQGDVLLGPKLNEIADLSITFVPSSEESTRATLALSLDYLRNYLAERYEVETEWKQNGSVIQFFYAGSDESYAKLPKRD